MSPIASTVTPTPPAPGPAGGGVAAAAAASRIETTAAHALLRDCFAAFHADACGLAKLSIETSNDLFEMDSLVTMEQTFAFKSRRRDWLARFDATLRERFEARIAGQRRKGRRPDAEQSLGTLRVLSDTDARKQSALGDVTRRLLDAARPEQEALDHRVAFLLDDPPSLEADNPFSPAYLLDAIGMTSRALYEDPRIWRTVMERVVSDFVIAIAKTYVKLNRMLAERGILPEIGAVLRARSELRPADDGQLLPLFNRLLNEVHPSLQAWRSLDRSAATAASYHLAPFASNPYAAAAAATPSAGADTPQKPGEFPRVDAMMACGALAGVLHTLDGWQRADPLADHGPTGIDASVTPVNRIPWIHAALAGRIPDATGRSSVDVVGFLFDYIIRDVAIPPRLRLAFDGLQVPILKVALSDPGFFAAKRHPARRLVNELAEAAIGAADDAAYDRAFHKTATAIIASIRAEFVLDTRVFDRACRTLKEFTDERLAEVAARAAPHVERATAQESRDTDRSQVRALIRDKVAAAEIPPDVRAFVDTVWADYLTQLRQTEGPAGHGFVAAVATLDDMLWSITLKARSGQKAKLSRMIPGLVRALRAGGAAVQVTGEPIKRFLDVLYELHIAAIRPYDGNRPGPGAKAAAGLGTGAKGNVHDLIADLVLGTWFAFDRGGTWIHARLHWVSPLRAAYVFCGRGSADVLTFTPEVLAAETRAGRAALVTEPVPLFERAVSVTLEFLASQRARGAPEASRDGDAGASPARESSSAHSDPAQSGNSAAPPAQPRPAIPA